MLPDIVMKKDNKLMVFDENTKITEIENQFIQRVLSAIVMVFEDIYHHYTKKLSPCHE